MTDATDEVPELSTPTQTQLETKTSAYCSVAELAKDIGLSERSTRAALRRGEIPHIRIGRRFILPRAAIADWLRAAGRHIVSEDFRNKPAKLAVLASPR